MRTKEHLLHTFNDVKILLQYLYMDEKHTITVSNGITDLRIKLNEDFTAQAMNLSFPELGYSYRPMDFREWYGCVKQLKNMPSTSPMFVGKTAWEEIADTTFVNLAFNEGV